MRSVIAIGLLLLAGVSSEAMARENRTLRCNISAARAAPGGGAAALVANVPRSMTPIDLNAVMMTDKNVNRKIVVEGLYVRSTEMRTLEVVARFVNCTKEPLSIQVRSNFLTEAQSPAEPVSAWKTVFLSPRATGIYEERSMSAAVGSYLIEVRTPQ